MACAHAGKDLAHNRQGREAKLEKTPYVLVVGDKEVEDGSVAVRSRKDGDVGTMSLSEFKNKVVDEIEKKAN